MPKAEISPAHNTNKNLTSLRKLSESMFYGVGAFVYYDLIPVSGFKPFNCVMSAALGYASINCLGSAMKIAGGISEMERPDGPKRPPRLDHDVRTGLPNHRATEERREFLLAQAREKELAESFEWDHAIAGCWAAAEEIASLKRPDDLLT